MEQRSCQVFITAQAPEALTELCGISVLERLLRTLPRLGVTRVTVISATATAIREHVEQPSWARAALAIDVRETQFRTLAPRELARLEFHRARQILVLACWYYDARLLEALLERTRTTILVSSPQTLPQIGPEVHCEAAIIEQSWLLDAAPDEPLFAQLTKGIEQNEVAVLELAAQPTYVTSMRRKIPPTCFPPPVPEQVKSAEHIILDAAQNGTLDLPAMCHAPIETWLIRGLCRTSITPNQITAFTAAVSTIVIALFVLGDLVAGTLLALAVGVLDGLDGKQARVKVETTPLGRHEHALDYILELSWWTALACHFSVSGEVPHAYWLLLLLIGSDLVDRAAKRFAKQKTGRNLDDVATIDRFVRLIGGRRNIYIWIFAAGLLLRAADEAFVVLCCWSALTAAVHVLRALAIGRVSGTEGATH